MSEPRKIHFEELKDRARENNFEDAQLVYAQDPENKKWIAIDGVSQEHFMEEFETEEQCLAWLNNRDLTAEDALKIKNDPELESTTGDMFKKLNEEESFDYRAWARENYTPGNKVPEVWHPEIQDECRKMNEESKQVQIDWREEFDKLGPEENIGTLIENYMGSNHAIKSTKEEVLYIAKLLLNDPNAPVILKKKYFIVASEMEPNWSTKHT